MSRTRAEALVLVNWNGMFYERFLLDRHVTALEGANGVGKTTVMIAAYIVLLPDMSRLRFTNLGESGATGGDKGIWGRLGEPGRPSYCAIEFALPGAQRLVAGVHLERKGEPSVEPTPFLVEGLDDSVRLQDLLLIQQGDGEGVPELPELRESAARLGGTLKVFSSAREYFAALFEAGVTPLRLGTDEERGKLNDMLRTSMTGGISRALTSELRSFLLKADGRLADTLQRMKANLDACRRTRVEVQESQRLEIEIGGVFAAGHAMFAAAVLATRERANEHERRVIAAEEQRLRAAAALEEAAAALAGTVAEHTAASEQREACEAAVVAARQRVGMLKEARAAAADVRQREVSLRAAEAGELATRLERGTAEATRESRRADLIRARESYSLAAAGLKDLEAGLDRLHHRAGAHRQVSRRLTEGTELLELQALRTEDIPSRLAACREDLARVDATRRDAARQISDAESHRAVHRETLAALQSIVGDERIVADARDVALGALERQRDLAALAKQEPRLSEDLQVARRHAAQQVTARRRAAELGVVPDDTPGSDRVRRALVAAEGEQRRHQSESDEARTALADAGRDLSAARERIRELAQAEPIWQDVAVRVERLESASGVDIGDATSLARARASVADDLRRVQSRETELSEAAERLHAESRALLAAGGPFSDDLLRVKDELGADLVAERFDDVTVEEAGRLEARLGPLAQALVVDDPATAARSLAGRPDSLASMWLVARDASESSLGLVAEHQQADSRDVIVVEGEALRVSRVPERPCLGRRAREQRVAQLREEAEQHVEALSEVRARRRNLERLLDDGEHVLAHQGLWLAGDPGVPLAETRKRAESLQSDVEKHRASETRCADAARALRPRIDALRGLLGEAHLLDAPDHGSRAEQLAIDVVKATDAKKEAARCAPAARVVEHNLDSLGHAPLSDDEVADLTRRLTALQTERDRLDAAIDALDYVCDNVEALSWGDAAETLAQRRALVPALNKQLTDAGAATDAADQAARVADQAFDDATASWQDADGARRAARSQFEASKASFDSLDLPEPTQEAIVDAERDAVRLDGDLRRFGDLLQQLATNKGRCETVLAQAAASKQTAEEKLADERRDAAPAVERWEKLRELAAGHQLLAGALTADVEGVSELRGHVNLVQEANKQRALLVERLGSAHGGRELLATVQGEGDGQELKFAERCLELWLAARDWLRRRLPAQFSEIDDPREGLVRLRDQLVGLEERLARQEQDLRGSSSDVARGIDVQIRRARGQVQRLNANLEGVSFGGIDTIRARLTRVEKMEQVLRALREGAVQALLFQANLPIEEALDTIFRQYGGGRGSGQRLLDYREYVHLEIRIRRTTGSDWEVANPTRLSTGEAIGVGAALMMVVLTEWERDANLLRGRREWGSLRFLFLDEANRLSYDNLGVLFDLCKTLELQLLIAAPEVARAEGNTTYRLVRRASDAGRDEVLVSGRRTRAEA